MPSHSALSLPSPASAGEILSRASALLDAGDAAATLDYLLEEAQVVRSHPVGCNLLGYLLLHAGRCDESVSWFEAALSLAPAHAPALSGLAMALQALGQDGPALHAFERVLALKPADVSAWYSRGLLLARAGRATEAIGSLDRALEIDAGHVQALIERSRIENELGAREAAMADAFRACKLAPDMVEAWARLGDALQATGERAAAVAAYDQALEIDPDHFACLCNRAHVLKEDERPQEALASIRRATALAPDDLDALLAQGALERECGDDAAALATFLRVARHGVARRHKAAHSPASLRALLVFTPFGGNTPYEDLILGANFDADLVLALPGWDYDCAAIGQDVDVVVSLLSEPDLGGDALEPIAALCDRLGKPLVNPPRLIPATDRASIAARLAHIDGAVMPQTIAVSEEMLSHDLAAGAPPKLPVIIRQAGTHGGELMELIETRDQLEAFLPEVRGQKLYLTDYVDYSSADGFFRKYRFVFVGKEILPYHLAIGDGWKVHHAATRMRDFEWMREEEHDFLARPAAHFGPVAMAALEAVRATIGLDFFGIDCGLTRDGRLVIFEVNASMLVHLANYGFEYKNPFVHDIKAAFERLLAAKAAEARH